MVPHSGKLSREKTFANWWKIQFSQTRLPWIARFCSTKGATPPKFMEKTFVNSHKTAKFVKFSPSKVSRYTVIVFYLHQQTMLNYHEPYFKYRYFPSCVLTVCRILALSSHTMFCSPHAWNTYNNNSSQAKFLYHKILLLWWCQHTPPKLWMVWKESFWNQNQPCILFHEVGQPGERVQNIWCTGIPCRSTNRCFQVTARSSWRKVNWNIMLLTSPRVVKTNSKSLAATYTAISSDSYKLNLM